MIYLTRLLSWLHWRMYEYIIWRDSSAHIFDTLLNMTRIPYRERAHLEAQLYQAANDLATIPNPTIDEIVNMITEDYGMLVFPTITTGDSSITISDN